MKKERVKKILRFMRFAVGGGTALVMYYIILYVLTEFVDVWYVVSSAIAGILSFGINFILQKFWTFRNHDKRSMPKQVAWYAVMKLCLLVAGTALLYWLVEYLHLRYLIASAILTVFFSIVSYIITHKIFAD